MGCATTQAAAQRKKERLAEASNPDKVALSVLSHHNSSLPYLEGSTVRGTIVELNRRTVKIDAGLSQRIRFFRQALPWLGCRHDADSDPFHSWTICLSRVAGALSKVSLPITMPWHGIADAVLTAQFRLTSHKGSVEQWLEVAGLLAVWHARPAQSKC